MISTKKLVMALAGGFCVLFSGCTTIRELPPEETVQIRKADPEYELCRNLLGAFLKNDAKGFIALLPENLRKDFTPEKFKATRTWITESMGEPIEFRYVTRLELVTFTPHIWKIRFKRTDRRTEKEYTSELLFRIVTAMLDNQAVVTGFQFL